MVAADLVSIAERFLDVSDWDTVPGRVSVLYKAAAPIAEQIAKQTKDLPHDPGYGQVFWHPKEKTVWFVLGDGDEQDHYDQWKAAIGSIAGVKEIKAESEGFPPDRENWVMVKRAAPLSWLSAPFRTAGNLTGGSRPLTSAIVGSLLTGGLGYGAGAALEHLFPERYVERGKLRKTLGLTGLGLGAMPSLYLASARSRSDPQQRGYFRALTAPWEKPAFLKAADDLAAFASTGALGLPSIPVDAFNNAIWMDVHKGVNSARYSPYGTKDPFGTNEQPLHTPPAVGAVASGLVSGINAASGSTGMLRPIDVIRGIASAGVGLATANIAGRVLSGLAGLTPEAQGKLQDFGLWGGLITGTVKSMLGR